MSTEQTGKIWVNSADSHAWEPKDLWTKNLPARLKDRGPRIERKDRYDVYLVDDKQVYFARAEMLDAITPPGSLDLDLRMKDLDDQGIWAEVIFGSNGLWITVMEDRGLARECIRIWNDWAKAEIMNRSERYIPAALLSSASIDDAIEEAKRVAKLGFKTVCLPTTIAPEREYNNSEWDGLWAVCNEAGMVISFHVGTGTEKLVFTRGPGGAMINFWETTVPAQRCVVHMVASGALDRFRNLKVLTAEAGAAWVPALADRLDEAYRQHQLFLNPKLERLPTEIIKSQVYTSFQHDETAMDAVEHLGFDNIAWGSDYPHMEGTFPKTQEVLHHLFDEYPKKVVERVARGTFEELFGVRVPKNLVAQAS